MTYDLADEPTPYKEPSFYKRWWDNLWFSYKRWQYRNAPGGLELHTMRELKVAGYIPLDQEQEDGPNKWIQENVLELIRVFAKQGHSGFSASYCISVFSTLAKFEPLGPILGTDDEWNEVGDGVWQNNRCSHIFKDPDGRAYDINGRIFREPNGGCYTNSDSRVYIEFPYTPKSEYVDVEESKDE